MDTFTALERLRRLFLGQSSEKTKKVLGDDEAGDEDEKEGEPVPSREALAAGESEKTADRTGVRTSGIVSKVGEHRVALEVGAVGHSRRLGQGNHA